MEEGRERTRIEAVEARYRRVLETSVAFERRIRDRWRAKCRAKNARIAELEARVVRLEGLLYEKEIGVDRQEKERRLVALMVGDLGVADIDEREMTRLVSEVGDLSDRDLDAMLRQRLGLAEGTGDDAVADAMRGVDEPERLSDGYTGAPDMSHEGRPEERD